VCDNELQLVARLPLDGVQEDVPRLVDTLNRNDEGSGRAWDALTVQGQKFLMEECFRAFEVPWTVLNAKNLSITCDQERLYGQEFVWDGYFSNRFHGDVVRGLLAKAGIYDGKPPTLSGLVLTVGNGDEYAFGGSYEITGHSKSYVSLSRVEEESEEEDDDDGERPH
jgi:hypothetical protein